MVTGKQVLLAVFMLAISIKLSLAGDAAQTSNAGKQVTLPSPPVVSAGTVFIEPLTGMALVNVPAGCFQMGDTYGDGQGDEKPVHEVCLDAFSMGIHEVTNSQYRRFKPGHDSGIYEGNSLNGNDQPVANISWFEAMEYAQWLSEKTGRRYRLPTEAEWEYAARGGASARNYWGDGPLDACLFANGADLAAKNQWPDWTITACNDGYKVAAPTGRFKPNGFGLYDMMGNAWEWTNDWYDAQYYLNSPLKNPAGPATGVLRIPRGGGWGNASECVRVADRNGFAPDFRILFLGFRLVSNVRSN